MMTDELARVLDELRGGGARHGNQEEFGARGGRPKGLEQWWTPPGLGRLVRNLVDLRLDSDEVPVFDLTAGAGHLLAHFRYGFGIEYDEAAVSAARTRVIPAHERAFRGGRLRIYRGDIRVVGPVLRQTFPRSLDALVLNPPFGLRWNLRTPDGRVVEMNSTEYTLRLAWELLSEDGVIVALIPATVFEEPTPTTWRSLRRWLDGRVFGRIRIPRAWHTADVETAVVVLTRDAPPERVPDVSAVVDPSDPEAVDAWWFDRAGEFYPAVRPARHVRPILTQSARLDELEAALERACGQGVPTTGAVRLAGDGRSVRVEAPVWYPADLLRMDGMTLDRLAANPALQTRLRDYAQRYRLTVDPALAGALERANARLEEALIPVMPIANETFAFFFARDMSVLENLFSEPVEVVDDRGTRLALRPERRYVITFHTEVRSESLASSDPSRELRLEKPVTYVVVRDMEAPDVEGFFTVDRTPELARLFRPGAIRDVRRTPHFGPALRLVRSDPAVGRIPLFDWQAEDVATMIALPERGRRGMFIADTGTGKSHMTAAAAVARLRMEGRRGGLILFVTKKDLVPVLEERIRGFGMPTAVIESVEDVVRLRRDPRRRDDFLFAFVADSDIARPTHTRRLPPISLDGYHLFCVRARTPREAEAAVRVVRERLEAAGVEVAEALPAGVAAGPVVPLPGRPVGVVVVRTPEDPPPRLPVAAFRTVVSLEAEAAADVLARWAQRLVPAFEGLRPQTDGRAVAFYRESGKLEGRIAFRGRHGAVVERTLKPPEAGKTDCCLRPWAFRPVCRRCDPDRGSRGAPPETSPYETAVRELYREHVNPRVDPPGAHAAWEALRHVPQAVRRRAYRKALAAARAASAPGRNVLEYPDTLARALRRLRADAVIIDEIDRFADSTTERSAHLARVVWGVPIRFGATATLIPNWPYQAYFPLKLIYDRYLPWKSAREFNENIQAYVVVTKHFLETHSHRTYRRIKPDDVNVGAWLRYVAPLTLRRPQTATDRVVASLDVPLSEPQKEAYVYWLRSFAEWFLEHVRQDMSETSVRFMQEVLGRLMKLRQVVSAAPDVFRSPGAPAVPPHVPPRTAAAAAVVRLLLTHDRRPIVFCPFREEAEVLGRLLERLGYRTLVVHGGVPPKRRAELITTANRDPDVEVLVTTLEAVDRGHDLQGFSGAVMTGEDWRPGQLYQVWGRMTRYGQRYGRVPVVLLQTPHTVQHYILHLLNAKNRDIRRLIEGEIIREPRQIVDMFVSEETALLAALRSCFMSLQEVHAMAERIPVVPPVPEERLGRLGRDGEAITRLSEVPRLWEGA